MKFHNGLKRMFKPRALRLWLTSGLIVGVAFGCGERPLGPELVPGTDGLGEVRLRNADSALYSQLVVQTWMGRYDLDARGRFDARFPDIDDNRFAFVTHRDTPNQAMYYGYYFPERLESPTLRPFVDRGQGIVIDARSTALTMVLINPLLFDSTVEQRAMIAEEALQHPRFNTLVRAIEDHRAIDPTGGIRYERTPDLFMLSGGITIDSLQTIAARLPDRVESETLVPQSGVVYDYNMAYPQVSNDGFAKLTIFNPKMAHYVAAYRTPGDENFENAKIHFVPGKERWLNISIFPPKIETVPPTQTPFNLDLGGGYLEIFKGFQFNKPFSAIWSVYPARMALVANSWASMNMMIALAGDISAILFPNAGGVITYITNHFQNPQEFTAVWDSVEERNRTKTINNMYQLFVALLPSLEQYIKDEAQRVYGDATGNSGIFTQIGTLFDAVWSLVAGGGVVNSIINITTQTIPFYYDLFTAHSHAIYPVFDGGLQPLPDSATFSRVMPQTVSNGRNAAAWGFAFGNEPGRVYVTGATGTTYTVPVLSWEDAMVLFKLPPNETGIGAGEQKLVYVALETKNGTLTNSLEVPFRVLEEGEGGGGCAVVPNGKADPAGLLTFALMLGLPLLYARRRRCR